MIEYVKGTLAELSPATAIIEAGGVGYELLISLNSYTVLQGKESAKLFTFESIREDAHLLYGFCTKEERELFSMLIGISGIGGGTARMLLSAFSPAELAGLIQNEDVRMIKSVKGIGPKAAQRIVVELRDKVQGMAQGYAPEGAAKDKVSMTEAAKEAASALTTLGFPPAPVQKCVMAIVKQNPNATPEEIIKQGLKML